MNGEEQELAARYRRTGGATPTAQERAELQCALGEGSLARRAMTGTYSEAASPNVPPLQRERRDQLLAWLRAQSERMDIRTICAKAPIYNGVNNLDDLDVCRNDINQLERYGFVRSVGTHPGRWEATTWMA